MANDFPKIDNENILKNEEDNKKDGRSPRPTTSDVSRDTNETIDFPTNETIDFPTMDMPDQSEDTQQGGGFPTQSDFPTQGGMQQGGKGVSSTARFLANSIQQVESGGDPTAQGASGEYGAFQFMPGTWKRISKEVEGKTLEQTPENERRVAEKKIDSLLQEGHSPREVALIWNTSLGGEEKPKEIKGVNDQGVEYDSGAYADKVESQFANNVPEYDSPFLPDFADDYFAPLPSGEGLRIRDLVREAPEQAYEFGKAALQDIPRFAASLANVTPGILEEGSETVAYGLSQATGVGDIDKPGSFADVFLNQDLIGDTEDSLIGTDSKTANVIFGDREGEDMNLHGFGGGFLEALGVEDPSMIASVPTAVFLGGLDWYPPTSGRGIRQASKAISNTKNLDDIIGILGNFIRGSDEEVRILGSGLRNVDNADDVEAILREAASDADDWISALTAAGRGDVTLRPSAGKRRIDDVLGRISDETDAGTIRASLDEIVVGNRQAVDDLAERVARDAGDDSFSAYDVRQRTLDELIPENPSNQMLRRTGRLNAEKTGRTAGNDLTRLERRLGVEAVASRRGAQATKSEIQDMQQQLTDLANEGDSSITKLSDFAYGNTVNTRIRNATDEQSFRAAQEFIEDTKQAMSEADEVAREAGKLRSNISYLRKLGRFDQRAINDAKSRVGAEKPISAMNLDELQRMQDEVQSKVQFLEERGLSTNRSLQDEAGRELTQDDYDEVVRQEKVRKTNWEKAKDTWKEFKGSVSEIAAPLSTRLRNVDPKLSHLLRNEYDIKKSRLIEKDRKLIDKAQEKITSVLDDAEMSMLDYAMKNGDSDQIDRILEGRPELQDIRQELRGFLDEIYSEAKSVNMDVEYREELFPRWIVNIDGFVDDILTDKNGTKFEQAINEFRSRMGRDPSQMEREDILNKLVRGYQQFGVRLADPAATRERVIETLSPEMNKYYANSFDAMKNYSMQMREAIEMKRLLGKEIENTGRYNLVEDGLNIESTIGAYIDEGLRSGRIEPEDLNEIRSIMEARFNPGRIPSWAGMGRSASYVGLLANPRSVLTQVEDIAVSFYENGMLNTFQGLSRAAIGNVQKTFEDTGLTMSSIELDEASGWKRFTDRMMRVSGFQKMENFMNEAMMEATLLQAQKNARRSLGDIPKGKYSVYDYAREFYGEGTQEYDDFIKKVADGEVDDDVINYAVSKILDYKPLTQSEMPEKYVTGNLSKVAYTLQSFTLKRMDTFRREIVQEMKENPKQGLSNLVRFTGYVAALGAGVDTVQDLMLGRDLPEEEQILTENLMKSVGPSKYLLDQINRQGFSAAAGDVLTAGAVAPKGLVNDLVDIWGGDLESAMDSEVVGMLPLIGVILNNRFGTYGQGGTSPGPGGGGGSNDFPTLDSGGIGGGADFPTLD